MSLYKIVKRQEPDNEERQAWKVLSRPASNLWALPYCNLYGVKINGVPSVSTSNVLPENVWLEAYDGQIANAILKERYPCGFHVFLSEEDAIQYWSHIQEGSSQTFFVREVRVQGIHTYGEDLRGIPVAVAKRLLLPAD